MTGLPRAVNAPDLAAPRGFSHAMVAEQGRTVWVAGQIAVDEAGHVRGGDFVTQFDLALRNVVIALAAAAAQPEHVVAMTVYTTDMDGYRSSLGELGSVWRSRMGSHYPAMALLGVAELVEPAATVEIQAVAVVPPSV